MEGEMSTQARFEGNGLVVWWVYPSVRQMRCWLAREVRDFRADYARGRVAKGLASFMVPLAARDVTDPSDVPDEEIPIIARELGVPRYAPSWWMQRQIDTHDGECQCGPMYLIDVIMNVVGPASPEVSEVLRLHIDAAHAVWDHYWSGVSMVEDDSDLAGNVCPGCLIDGADHLEEVFADCTSITRELGEIVAALDAEIKLTGKLRGGSGDAVKVD